MALLPVSTVHLKFDFGLLFTLSKQRRDKPLSQTPVHYSPLLQECQIINVLSTLLFQFIGKDLKTTAVFPLLSNVMEHIIKPSK